VRIVTPAGKVGYVPDDMTPSAPSTTTGSVSSRTLPAGRSPATSTIRAEQIIETIEDGAREAEAWRRGEVRMCREKRKTPVE
jgi:hypothetical protein